MATFSLNLLIVQLIIIPWWYNSIIILNNLDGESLNEIADVIVNATGPSGANKSYVTGLAQGLRNLDIGENKAKHVFEVERAVKKRQQGILLFICWNRQDLV